MITAHTGSRVALLPYPLKRLTNFGWYGVQLFFLMSCVTLLLSWHSEERKGGVDLRAFWVRRFFRIAPLYYLAAAAYFVIDRPMAGFDLRQLLASLAFVNAWYPTLIPTTPTGWTVVPGGWSIGVEFTFYALFPLVARYLRSLRSALGFLALTLPASILANMGARAWLHGRFDDPSTTQFLFYWFPNQLPVFALGVVLFHALGRPKITLLARLQPLVLLLCGAGGIVAAEAHLPKIWGYNAGLLPPASLVASCLFAAAALTLASGPGSLLVNRAIRALGTVSFSAYLTHFAVLEMLSRQFDLSGSSLLVTAAFAALWLATVSVTYGVSWALYRWVEAPMIDRGRRFFKPAALPTGA